VARPSTVRASNSARNGSFHVESASHTGHDTRGEQRVSPQIEKVIMDANRVQAQHVGPDAGQGFSIAVRGGQIPLPAEVFPGPGAGEGATVHLAGRGSEAANRA